jgi:hypothetical protein
MLVLAFLLTKGKAMRLMVQQIAGTALIGVRGISGAVST